MTSPLPALDRFRNLLSGKAATDARFQHVLEQMANAAFIIQPRSGLFVASNARAAALTGWTREEVAEQSLAEVVAAPDAVKQLHDLQPGESAQLRDIPLRVRVGRPPEKVDLRATAFLDHNGETALLALLTPSAERRLQERERATFDVALHELQRLPVLFESPTPATLNLATSIAREALSADAAGLYLIPESSNTFVLGCVDGVPDSFPRTLGPAEAQQLKAPFRWTASQRSETFLAQACRAAGWAQLLAHPLGQAPNFLGALFVAYRPANPQPSRANVFLSFAAQNVTQLHYQIRRLAQLDDQERLATLRANQLAAVHSQIDVGVVMLDSFGLVDELNQAAANLMGYRPEEVVGLPFQDVLVPDETLTAAIHAMLDPEAKWSSLDRRGHLNRRNGESFPAYIRMRKLSAPSRGFVLVFNDLSQEQASQTQREHLDHLAYVGQTTATFAHEIRNPLNAISLGVQMIGAQLPEDHSAQTQIAKIEDETERLSSLMGELLAWTKPIDPKMEPVTLNDLLERLLVRWAPKMGKHNVKPTFNPPDKPVVVLADFKMIERVFTNLIDNAVKAMPAGGTLTIWMKMGQRAGLPAVETVVHDSGRGIPADMVKRIFEPYVTGRADGTGLGLAICRRIITIHHGGIDVESFPGAGTAFKVTLPVMQEPAA